MRRNLSRFSLAFVLCLCAIALSTTISFASIPDNAKALAALDAEWSKAAVAGDLDRVVSFYADDAVAYPPNEPAASGKAAIKEGWQKMVGDPKTKISWKTDSAGVDHNTGFTAGSYQVTTAGKVVEKGKYLCVWRKGTDGKWKAIHDMWNADSK